MTINHQKQGQGFPLIILHGLFGSADNWHSIAKKCSDYFTVYNLDLPNHGLSSHTDHTDYPFLAKEILNFMDKEGIEKAHICGHSMGGKVAMQLSHDAPERIERLIVVDIAPKEYEPHHQDIIAGIQAVAQKACSSRKEAEKILTDYIDNSMLRLWLLKSFKVKEERGDWIFNHELLIKGYSEIAASPIFQAPNHHLTTFIRGGDSDYILDSDIPGLEEKFPNMTLYTIEGTGHWLHAQKPIEFFQVLVKGFGFN